MSSDATWEDMETLVFDRDDMQAALEAARSVLDDATVITTARPSLVVLASEDDLASLDEGDAWIDALPSSARAILESARRQVPAWPDAPRLAHAIARPAEA